MPSMRISAIIPCYNADCFVTETIKALQNQSLPPKEIIVVDDGSTDNSLAMIHALAANDPRIQVIHQTNAGVSRARLRGLAHSNAEFVYFVDADDVPAPGALERLAQGFAENPQAVLCYGAAQMTDGALNPIASASQSAPSGAILRHQLRRNRMVMGGALIRKAALRSDCLDHALPWGEDLIMWAQIAASGLCFYIGGAPVIFYRKHHHNATRYENLSPQRLLQSVEWLFSYAPVMDALTARERRRLKRRRQAAAYSFLAKTALQEGKQKAAARHAAAALAFEPLNAKLLFLWFISQSAWLTRICRPFVFH